MDIDWRDVKKGVEEGDRYSFDYSMIESTQVLSPALILKLLLKPVKSHP